MRKNIKLSDIDIIIDELNDKNVQLIKKLREIYWKNK